MPRDLRPPREAHVCFSLNRRAYKLPGLGDHRVAELSPPPSSSEGPSAPKAQGPGTIPFFQPSQPWKDTRPTTHWIPDMGLSQADHNSTFRSARLRTSSDFTDRYRRPQASSAFAMEDAAAACIPRRTPMWLYHPGAAPSVLFINHV